MATSGNATTPIDKRLWLAPSGVAQGASGGAYYWIFIDPANQTDAVWGAYQRTNPTLKVVKTQGDFFLLQNIGTNAVLWALPGFPSLAPKGPATTPADVIQAPEPEKNLLDRLYDAFYGENGFFHELGFVSKVAIYGGIGVGLYSLYRHLNPPTKEEHRALPSGEHDDAISSAERNTERSPHSTLSSRYR